MWTFGRKLTIGFSLSFALLLIIGVMSYRAVDTLTTTSYQVTRTHQAQAHIAALMSAMKDAETGQRGFMLTADDAYLDPYRTALADIPRLLAELRPLIRDNPAQQTRLNQAAIMIENLMTLHKDRIEIRRNSPAESALKLIRTGEGKRRMDDLRAIIDQMMDAEEEVLKQRAADVETTASNVRTAIFSGTIAGLLLVLGAGYVLNRALSGQVGAAVRHVQRSAAELQAAANQQAAGARETATSMTEISTTISELLATSRQIADSAQRVVQIAEQTATYARGGEGTLQGARDTIVAMRRQIDQVVGHMLDLGQKSQRIGVVLDLVSELAEQTNILAINATIEATVAGDAGRRFGVVADEIRKLADRMTASTKEIRLQIDDMRGAVNTTVMATEAGSKAVDAGARQFDDVASTFARIAGQVVTTTEAAREIELSTKQQATAVEQLNIALSNTAQASRETETSSGQTSQTATELAQTSRQLLSLVQAQPT
ncbi:CHASE3 domain-containing protein [Roseateles depolymerans]|uniref:Putative periplasmic ligand-binding sensor domain protein n=1 Tax=Roseateles depolymerans TaxID=76731 RepID=A0A0U3MDW2_9BURK|nr:CHASE3 domain-containing protein [Roseateles depolymerans]ALV05676.1 Putative periplasmic ligand-binding sensor domain protein [Roseateles depolymerans]REG13054.1 methyl-accepting chemotaxis protein (MCP) signaling protein [Roseateles depolymerans]